MASILSLPVLKDVAECADFSLTVKPYIPQLLNLPSQFASIASSSTKLDDLSTIYLNTNPLISGFAISLALGPIFLILSEVNKNYSIVDRLWSILPPAHIAHFTLWAHLNGLPTQKLDNVLAFSTIWGVRLTYNFWRKGGYSSGHEDYRWELIKAKIGNANMFLFNVTFISFIQSVGIISSHTQKYILILA
jgi:steroid 5-alpha reductase family enzyme